MKLVNPYERVSARQQPASSAETASIADDAARYATTIAQVQDVDGKLVAVRVDVRNRICLPQAG